MSKKIKKSFLNAVSALTLLSASAGANVTVENIKEQEGWGSYFVRKAGNAVKGVSHGVANFVGQKIDDKSEDIINQIAKSAGQKASQAIVNKLFVNPDSYGLDHEGRRIPIYNNKSTILNSLFKQVGFDLNAIFDNMPIGMKQIMGGLRPSIETYLAKNLVAKLPNLGVEKAVREALLKGYGFSAEKIRELTKDTLAPTNASTAQRAPKAASEESDFAAILSNFNFTDDMVVDDFSDVDPLENGITLKHVLDQYVFNMTVFLNQQIKDSITSVVESATKEIAEKTYNRPVAK